MTDATSSTTSTTSTTAAPQSIALALGVGSGVDTGALVTSLVNAQYADKKAQLATKETAFEAQVSSVAQLQSGITSFASALGSLVKGGSLVTQPTSSNSNVLTATALTGAKLAGLSASVEVTRLATAQTATTAIPIATRSTTVGTGILTFTFGTATVSDGAMTGFTANAAQPITVPIDSANSTLDGIAKSINAAKAGITATVVTDADGTARLSLKGPTGTANAFTLSGDTPGLATLNVGKDQAATTIGSTAGNAALKLDGVAIERASNSISDLIDGVKLDLTSASIGNPVTIGSSTPTAGLTQAVSDFVETFNQMQAVVTGQIDATTGPLHNDLAATKLARSLSTLTTTNLVTGMPAGAPKTLAEIGVGTNRDGTLTVDATKLSAAMAQWPDVIEAMFADGTGASGAGIGAALNAISTTATDKNYGLVASTATYTKGEADISDQQTAMASDADNMTTRLTQQFASMDARVAVYKSTLSFLQAQIAAWNTQT
jgi:flagellar hook-associated protein 2